MVHYVMKGQSYQVIKNCKDLRAKEKLKISAKWYQELYNIG